MNYHMCVDISGALRRTDCELGKLFTDDGVPVSGKHARDWLKLQLAHGKRVIPLGECDNFDHQKGCLGHPTKATP